MATHPKELVMLVAKDLTTKLMEKINFPQEPVPVETIVGNVGEIFQAMVTKVSQVLTDLG